MCCFCSGIGFVRLLADYNQVDGNSFLEADLQNNFMGIIYSSLLAGFGVK